MSTPINRNRFQVVLQRNKKVEDTTRRNNREVPIDKIAVLFQVSESDFFRARQAVFRSSI